MKKTLSILAVAMLLTCPQGFSQNYKRCGHEELKAAMIARHPEAAAEFERQRASLQAIADEYTPYVTGNATAKTTATSAIPVVFHIIVDSIQFNQLGGTAGIIKRCDSQIKVIERDFNRKNYDSASIPSLWKPLYSSVGVHFGLAHTSPTGVATPGYEIRIKPTPSGFSDVANSFASAKHYSSGGLNAWDVNKYLNVWCINFTGSASSLLGMAVPPSATVGLGATDPNEKGICIVYKSLGRRTAMTDVYPSGYDLGRTLTHEIGHYFEIWHTWGDDGGLCKWSPGGDDGLWDTPPQADATYGAPAYTITGGTIKDFCNDSLSFTNRQPKGIACLSFMDYTNDNAMRMFTTQQAAVMYSKVIPSGSESYTLTQNPSLLLYPVSAVACIEVEKSLNMFPNPTTGEIQISFDNNVDELQQITVMNMVGQVVANMNTEDQKKDNFSLNLTGMSKGIYFVKCNFVSGSVTRKITLQ